MCSTSSEGAMSIMTHIIRGGFEQVAQNGLAQVAVGDHAFDLLVRLSPGRMSSPGGGLDHF
jgi:hypothetical protein